MELITKEQAKQMVFYHQEEDDIIWWVDNSVKGELLFTFDKQKVYNLFADYPWELTKNEKKIFDKENPFWANFFKDRQ